MKEPLYRAKTHSGEWVYGYYVKYGKHNHKIHSIDKDGNVVCQCGIDILTLCEYTGLTDKNGTKIFEGDILRVCLYGSLCEDKSKWETENGAVVYENGCFKIGEIYSSDGYNELSCLYEQISNYNGGYDESAIFEVIGNIYDNPELLEQGE